MKQHGYEDHEKGGNMDVPTAKEPVVGIMKETAHRRSGEMIKRTDKSIANSRQKSIANSRRRKQVRSETGDTISQSSSRIQSIIR